MKALAPSKGFAVYFHPNIPIVVWLENIRTLVQKFRQNKRADKKEALKDQMQKKRQKKMLVKRTKAVLLKNVTFIYYVN